MPPPHTLHRGTEAQHGMAASSTVTAAIETNLSVRRRSLERFRRGDGVDGRPAWNASTLDVAHPFPQPALMHTNACYNGVEVCSTHFPETVKGSGFLRQPPSSRQPAVWTRNHTRATAASTRHTYHCAALDGHAAPRSYLATVIAEDAAPEKRQLQEGWCASTALDGSRGNRFIAPKPEDVSHANAHRAWNETLASAERYVTPYNRVKELNATRSEQRQLQQVARTETLDSLYAPTATRPTVFKMSNAEEWWDMDPVAVTRAMTTRVEEMKANPCSTIFRSSPPPKAEEQVTL